MHDEATVAINGDASLSSKLTSGNPKARGGKLDTVCLTTTKAHCYSPAVLRASLCEPVSVGDLANGRVVMCDGLNKRRKCDAVFF